MSMGSDLVDADFARDQRTARAYARQHFFVGGKYLGSRHVPAFHRSADFGMRLTWSCCYFCPQCPGIWAQLIVEGTDYAQCWVERCAKHGGGRLDRDSRWESWPTALEANWPREAIRHVLLYEINLALKGPR